MTILSMTLPISPLYQQSVETQSLAHLSNENTPHFGNTGHQPNTLMTESCLLHSSAQFSITFEPLRSWYTMKTYAWPRWEGKSHSDTLCSNTRSLSNGSDRFQIGSQPILHSWSLGNDSKVNGAAKSHTYVLRHTHLFRIHLKAFLKVSHACKEGFWNITTQTPQACDGGGGKERY